MGEWSGARLRCGWDHLCDPRPRAGFDALRSERFEDCFRSGLGAAGERPGCRSASSDRSRCVRCARSGDPAVLRSADVLASGGSGPCGVDAACVRDHRLDAVRGFGDICERGGEAGLRRIGDTRSLGRRYHSDGMESGWHRSPSPWPRRCRRLRCRRSRLVASPRPLNPYHRALVRVLHRLRHRITGTTGWFVRTAASRRRVPAGRNGAQHA